MELVGFGTDYPHSPRLLAAFQQGLLIQALYRGDRSVWDDVVKGLPDSGVDLFDAFPDKTLPGYGVLHQGRDYFVVIAGTRNNTQACSDFAGYIGAPYPEQSGVVVHAYFYSVWQSLKTVILPLLPTDPAPASVHVAGHSLGAGVGAIAALDLARRFPRSFPQFMGLGCPAAFSGDVDASGLVFRVRWATEEDLVARMPDDAQLVTNRTILSSAIPMLRRDWTQIGILRTIRDGGRVEGEFRYETAFRYLLQMGGPALFKLHEMETYMERLFDACEGVEPQAIIIAIDNASNRTETTRPPARETEPPAPSTVTTPAKVNEVYYGNEPVVTSNDGINKARSVTLDITGSGPGESSADVFASALSLKGDGIMADHVKAIVTYTSPQDDDWHEEYSFGGTTVDAVAGLFKPSGATVQRRLKLLGPNNTMRRVRVEEQGGSRRGKPVSIELLGKSIATTTGQDYLMMSASAALICSMASADGSAKRHLNLRGLAQGTVGYVSNGVLKFDSGFKKALDDYFEQLEKIKVIIPYVKPATAGVNWQGVKVTNIDGTVAGKATLTTLGNHHFTTPVDPANKQRAILSLFSTKDYPALNGRYDVIDAPTAQTFVVGYNTPVRNNVAVASGKVRLETYVLNAIIDAASCGPVELRHRDTKNGDTLSRGRRRATARRGSP